MTTIEEIVKYQQELLNHQRNQKQHQRETIQLLNSLNKSITFMLDRLDEFAKRTHTKLEDYENADESQKPSSSLSSTLTSNIIPLVSTLKGPLSTSTNNFSNTNPSSTVSFSILPSGQNHIETNNGNKTSNNNKNFLSNIILVSNNGIQAESFAATLVPASNVVAKVPIPMLKNNNNNNNNTNNNLSKTNKSNQNRLFNRNQKVKEYFANDSKNNTAATVVNPNQSANTCTKLNDNIKQATTGFKLIDLNSSNAVLLGTQNGSTNNTNNINNTSTKLILDESMNDSYMDESNDSKSDDEEEVDDDRGLLNSSSFSNRSNKEKETIQTRKKSRVSHFSNI